MKIKVVKCPKCSDKVYSRSQHDYRSCSCGEVSVDGGHLKDYKFGEEKEWFFERIAYKEDVPETAFIKLDVTARQLYDDWNESNDKYGVLKTKSIEITYCESNSKYDVSINGEWKGKHYTVKEALKSISREL